MGNSSNNTIAYVFLKQMIKLKKKTYNRINIVIYQYHLDLIIFYCCLYLIRFAKYFMKRTAITRATLISSKTLPTIIMLVGLNTEQSGFHN